MPTSGKVSQRHRHKTPEDDSPGKAHGLPLSPSINFIDASMSESMEQSTNSQVAGMPEEEVSKSFIGKEHRMRNDLNML